MEIKPTQRAYTLRLRGANKDDNAWRDNLWKTHEAVNKGAKVFGDWLLTLRGGLDHRLADTKDKRIVLALSWLSVESDDDQPNNLRVATGKDTDADRKREIENALQNILKARGISDRNEISAWIDDCSLSLQAAIREDAIWVNRSGAFDNMCNGLDIQKARKDAQTLLWHLFTDDYLVLPKQKKSKKKSIGDQNPEELLDEELNEEKSNIAVKSGKGAGQKTRHPFSHIFGFKEDSVGFGKSKQKLELKDNWKQYLKPFIDSTGIPLADIKQLKRKDDEASPTELQREMFSKAASRLAQIHTKQKQQEVEREQRKAADEELKRLEYIPAYKDALELLKDYCEKYGESLGSLREFQIQRRQITKWDKIVDAWAKVSDSNPDAIEEKRRDEAKRLQEEYRDEKFGDINLFMRLAEEEYKPVWWHDDKPNASILRIFVEGMKARSDAKHLKVAAYRHPDPYFNPVFCQFGNSRPQIDFERLKKKSDGDIRKVELLLWDGKKATTTTPLLAIGQRFDEDFGSRHENAAKAESLPLVPRRDRLALAMAGQFPENVRVANIFDLKEKKKRPQTDSDNNDKHTKPKEPEWNGTLQADRSELERIGNLLKTDQTRAEKLVKQMKWWLIVSMELQTQGPWFDFVNNCKDAAFERTYKSGAKKGQTYISYGMPHEAENSGRSGMSYLNLSRLPGLRVLSVDLGHRYAAACAVWETLSSDKFKEECEKAKAEGARVQINDLYAMFEYPERKSNNASKKAIAEGRDKFNPTTIYRRIGANTLPDGSQHPAPWAKLDRQFLVKLQGEDRDARKSSPAEMEAIKKIEKELGFIASDERSQQVDDLMSDAVNTIRLALRRHSDTARIAHYLITEERTRPGGKKEKLDDNGRIETITDALEFWHSLATSKRWQDKFAEDLWKQCFPEAQLSKIDEEEKNRQQIKKEKKAFREQTLKPIAEKLAKNESLCMKLSAQWTTRWREEDGNWQKRLRWLSDWILPRGDRAKGGTIRNVGGLSLTRIATIKSLYQVQKAYHMRPEPDDLRKNIPDKGDDSMRGFGQSILDAMENMREQRVKQLASRIAEAALGVGRIKIPKKGKDPKRPCKEVDKPCHAVVIENLTHYRPEETRTRRENQQLMQWSSAKVKKYLSEACQLHGLYLREVPAGYTSRQDSRMGAPGVRCTDVPVNDFLNSAYWKNEVKRAEDKLKENKGDAYERYILDLSKKWANASDEDKKKTIRIPRKGGEIFVSADGKSPVAKGIQADLNAAANIGLKAIIDPDWPGRWWYVPCDSKGAPVKDKVSGSKAFDNVETLLREAIVDSEDSTPKVKKKRTKEDKNEKRKDVVNLWRDVSSNPLAEGNWQEFTPYWRWVNRRVVEILQKSANICA